MKRTTAYKGIYRLGDNHFQVRVSAGKHPITQKPLEKVKNFRGSLTDALDFQSELRREVKTSKTALNNITLNELCLRYLEHADDHLSPSTVKKYRSDFHDKVENGIGKRPAKSIPTEDFDRLFSSLKSTRHIKGKTVNKFRSFLISAYDQGILWRLVSYNQVSATTRFYEEEYEGEGVETEMVKATLKVYEDVDPRMGKLLELTCINQLRRGEACALRVSNFSAADETLRVSQVVLEPKGGGYTIKDFPKNKKPRTVDLDPISVGILSEFAEGKKDDAFLFSDNGGVDPWLPGRVTQNQARIRSRICPKCFGYDAKLKTCDSCGVARGIYFRLHDLRGHTTTALIEAGMSKAAQQRGGWKNEQAMFKHYNKSTKKGRDAAVATITELFGQTAS